MRFFFNISAENLSDVNLKFIIIDLKIKHWITFHKSGPIAKDSLLPKTMFKMNSVRYNFFEFLEKSKVNYIVEKIRGIAGGVPGEYVE